MNRATLTIDPNVQIALGLLFHIKHDYDKAIDCFKCALNLDKSNYGLWNKLGATLANSGASKYQLYIFKSLFLIEKIESNTTL